MDQIGSIGQDGQEKRQVLLLVHQVTTQKDMVIKVFVSYLCSQIFINRLYKSLK